MAGDGLKPRLWVFEPHFGDAITAVGGSLVAQRASCDVGILTVFGIAGPLMHADPAPSGDVLRAGGRAAADALGVGHHTFELPEASLRFQPAQVWKERGVSALRPSFRAFQRHPPDLAELRELETRMNDFFARHRPDALWLPLAVGGHPDHRLARDAALAAAVKSSHLPLVRLYAEPQFVRKYPGHAEALAEALRTAGAEVEEELADVRASLAEKKRAIESLAPGSRAQLSDDELSHERFFRVDVLGHPLDPIETSVRRDEARSLWSKVRDDWESMRTAKLVRVASPGGFGRFAWDMSTLVRAFPEAEVEVVVREADVWETAGTMHPHVRVRSNGPSERKADIAIYADPEMGPPPAWVNEAGKVLRCGAVSEVCTLLKQLVP